MFNCWHRSENLFFRIDTSWTSAFTSQVARISFPYWVYYSINSELRQWCRSRGNSFIRFVLYSLVVVRLKQHRVFGSTLYYLCHLSYWTVGSTFATNYTLHKLHISFAELIQYQDHWNMVPLQSQNPGAYERPQMSWALGAMMCRSILMKLPQPSGLSNLSFYSFIFLA